MVWSAGCDPCPAHQIGAAQVMDRQRFGAGEQLTFGGHDARRKITREVQHTGASGTQQGIGHLCRDGLEAFVQDRKGHGIELRFGRSPPAAALSC